MASTLRDRSTDVEATRSQSQVGLPMLGAARTDRTPTPSQDAGGDWILPLIKRAQERVMQQKAAVITMGMSKTHYIEQLQGVGHLSVRRLGLLGEDFWLALIDELRTHFKLDDDAQQLARAVDAQRAAQSVIERIAAKRTR